MEKMFTSGAFPKDLSGTFKEVRAEVQKEEAKLRQDRGPVPLSNQTSQDAPVDTSIIEKSSAAMESGLDL